MPLPTATTATQKKTPSPGLKKSPPLVPLPMAPAPHVPDDTALVDAPVELHHDLARPVVVNVFELVDVPWFARERVGRVSRGCKTREPPRVDRSIGVISRACVCPPGATDVPCFCMTWRNLITTLDTGRTRTWRLPRFSALYMACWGEGMKEVRQRQTHRWQTLKENEWPGEPANALHAHRDCAHITTTPHVP